MGKSIKKRADQLDGRASEIDARISEIVAKLEAVQEEAEAVLPIQRNGKRQKAQEDHRVLAFKKKKAATSMEDAATEMLMNNLRRSFCAAIFPVGGSVLNVCLDLYNSDLLTDQQRNELVGIGNGMVSLVFDTLTGKKDIVKAIDEFVGLLKDVGNFFRNNPEIAIKIGGTILESLHPIGGFIKMALEQLLQADVPDPVEKGLMKGLTSLTSNFASLEETLETAAEHRLSSSRPKRE